MFSATIQAIAPVFLLIALGVLLRHRGLLEETVNAGISTLVFRVGLPALIFIKVSTSDLQTLWNGKAVACLLLSILFFIVLLWFVAQIWIKERRTWGAFVQASYRSNCAIVGFAVIQNHYGESGLAFGAMLLVFVMLIYNTSAVVVLNRASQAKDLTPQLFARMLATNPLILSLTFALLFNFADITLPGFVSITLNSLSKMVLPLALIAIGAELRLHLSRRYRYEIAIATILKVLIIPAIQMVAAYLLGIRGESLGVFTLMLASPTAVSAYVMAKAMGADEKLTAQIIVVSTAAGVLSMAGFVFWGQVSGWY